MLGIDFFIGTAAEAIAHLSKHGGLVVAPAAPSFIALQDDPDYRRAIAEADLAIADSGWAVLFWRLLRREKLTRISGLALFKALLETAEARVPKNLFWILPSEKAKTKTLEFARAGGYPIDVEDCYVAPRYVGGQAFSPSRRLRAGGLPAKPTDHGKRASGSASGAEPPARSEAPTARRERLPYNDQGFVVADESLIAILEQRKPKHVIIGIGGGMQDKLGSYLKHQLSYRPAIYCIGAAPGFVTGDQIVIPMWADRFFVGWIFRLIGQPRDYLARYWKARLLPFLIIKYGTKIPQLRTSG